MTPVAPATSPVPFTMPTMALPGLPSSRALCSLRQLTCGSGECLPTQQHCDLRPDCHDGSDEEGCVDCRLAPWSGWSPCSLNCGLGVTFQRRELLRPPLPGDSCPPDRLRLRSQPCFLQACPVAGAWTVWEAWGPCSVSCGGGHWSRWRSCVDPPPKNGGAPALGPPKKGHPMACSPVQGAQTAGWAVCTSVLCCAGRGWCPCAHPPAWILRPTEAAVGTVWRDAAVPRASSSMTPTACHSWSAPASWAES